jgi:8-oxo-dGTP diphosphatase
MGESIFTCAERETLEETGLRIKATKIVAVTNDVFDAASKHYVTIFVQCVMEEADAQPQVSSLCPPSPAPFHSFKRQKMAKRDLG